MRLRLRGEPNKSRVEYARADAQQLSCLLSLREPAMRDWRQVTVIVMFTRAAPPPVQFATEDQPNYLRFDAAAAI